jgi:hypothetical protein
MERFFEILPGALAWTTLILMVLLSWLFPTFISIFIILFDIYWLLKTIFLSFHFVATYKEMKVNMRIDWIEKLNEIKPNEEVLDNYKNKKFLTAPYSWREIYHLIILPMYNEPYEVVRESFIRLSSAHYPMEKIMVVLGLEERAPEYVFTNAEKIKNEFSSKFYKFIITIHPKDLPNEIPGKASNEAYAAEIAKKELIEASNIDENKVLVSVFDIDTQIFSEYFGRLTYVFLKTEDRMRSIYQPISLFMNNVYEASPFSRVVSFSASFWQMMQQSRPEKLTSFSSQSIPFSTLSEIGYWHRNIVSEDSRIFWQAFLKYHGNFKTTPLFYPVSMDAPEAESFWGTMKNIYKQQRRWAWGAENVTYLINGLIKDKVISFYKKVYWGFNTIEGYYSWATNAIMIFALGWLPLLLGGKHFNAMLLSYNLPHLTQFILSLSTVGIATSAILGVSLLPKKSDGIHFKDYLIYFLQWLLMPITLIVFGAIPAIEAQTRLMLSGKYRLGFWVTPKGRYAETGKGSEKRSSC